MIRRNVRLQTPVEENVVKITDTCAEIQAPVDRVWRLLGDLEKYAEWNPFLVRAEGVFAEDSVVQFAALLPGQNVVHIRPRILQVIPERLLRWKGHVPINRFLEGEHLIMVEPTSDDHTRIRHLEVFTGALVPVLKDLLREAERGYARMNAAMKARLEGQADACNTDPGLPIQSTKLKPGIQESAQDWVDWLSQPSSASHESRTGSHPYER